MMQFTYPFLLALPAAAALLLFARRKAGRAVLYPDSGVLAAAPRSLRLIARKPVLAGLAAAAFVALAFAAARPYRPSNVAIPKERRNIMLAIDVSGSMRTRDFRSGWQRTSRLDAVKGVLTKFIKERADDRIGLVVFGTNAFLQSPLTVDHGFLTEMVRRLQVGIAGEDTAIGDGIGLSVKRVQEIEGRSKTIVLLTDGVNRTGQVNPLKAAHIAKDLSIKIHTIGIGSEETAASAHPFMVQQSEFDAETLRKIADITGGVYFSASSIEKLQQVYDEIDKLELSQGEDPEHEVREEFYPLFSAACALIYTLLIVVGRGVFMKIP